MHFPSVFLARQHSHQKQIHFLSESSKFNVITLTAFLKLLVEAESPEITV